MHDEKMVSYLLMLGDGTLVYRQDIKDSEFNPTGIFSPFEPRTLDLTNMPRLQIVDSYVSADAWGHVITLWCTNSKLPDFDALRRYDTKPWRPWERVEGFDLEAAELALGQHVEESKTAAT